MSALPPTPGQTVGPFFRFGLDFPGAPELVAPHSADAIRLSGTVYDGAGEPVPDALLEIWQVDAAGAIPVEEGSFHRENFTGFGRAHVDPSGRYEFWTLNPGARFIALTVFARGVTDCLHTRIYLPERANDEFLATLSAEERATLIAERMPDGGLHHDIRLQGERETVFLAFR